MKSQRTGPGFRGRFCLLVLLLGSAADAAAQTAYLVRDLAPGADHSGSPSRPQGLFVAGGKVFFTAEQASAGRQLWVTDGTASGTEILTGCTGCGSDFTAIGAAGPLGLFLRNGQLWRSDGTRRGTYALTGAGVGLDGGGAYALASRTLYFGGCDGGTGCGLARTDGTPSGTAVLASSGGDGRIAEIAIVGPKIFFSTTHSLWASDGTADGTRKVHTFDGFGFPSAISHLTAAASRVFFLAPDVDPQLWTSDGTADGTRQLTSFAAPYPFSQTAGLKAAGDRVYFVADDVLHGAEIWTSDGTPGGTRAATEFGFHDPFGYADSGGDGLPVARMELAGGRLLFPASDGLTPLRLWRTTGDPASTAPVSDASPSSDTALVRVGERVVFFDQNGAFWSTDGTPAGTARLPGVTGRFSIGPFPLLGGAVLATDAGLWLSDGIPAHTRRLTDVPLALYDGLFSYPPGNVVELAGRLFFPASGEGPSDTELWTTDGRPGATRLVTEIELGAFSSDPQRLTALGGAVFFGVDTLVWRSAGTAATTVPVAPEVAFGEAFVNPAAAGGRIFFWRRDENFFFQLWSADASSPAAALTAFDSAGDAPQLAPLGNRVFFLRAMPTGLEMWASDGTPAGTAKAFDLPGLDFGGGFQRVGPRLYFAARPPVGSNELWASDGTAGGTRKILASPSLNVGDDLRWTAAGAFAFFRLDRRELWKTDGTAAGTGPVFGGSDPFSHQIQGLAALHGALYALGFDGSSGQAVLWRVDGTVPGAAEVQRFDHSLELPEAVELAATADRLFFTLADFAHGAELWTSDGTAAGTALARDIAPGPASSWLHGLTPAGNRVLFAADDGVHGVELWASDGTAAGTRLVHDVAPGALSSAPASFVVAGDRLYFTADDALHGRELWALPLAGAAGCQPSPARLCLNGGRFQVEAEWRDFQDHTGIGTAVPLTADTGTFWFFDPANVETVVKVLDGRGVNQAFWVFYGALSTVEYTLTVTDTATGLTRRYLNPSGQLASVGDTRGFGPLGAFAVSRPRAAGAPPAAALVAARSDPRAATGSCTAGAGTLCLSGDRFAVTAAWKDFQGHAGQGAAVPLTGDTGYFWFFDPANVEVVAKVLDGRAVNAKFWLFYGALSSVEYTLTVTDTQTGAVKMYRNPSGNLGSLADTAAF